MEIELRARILDEELLEQKLNQLPKIPEKMKEVRQVDIYFKHEGEEEEKMVIRIRKDYESNTALLTFKGKSRHTDDIAWHDFDTPISDPDRLEQVLLGHGYVYFVLIDKVRKTFKYEDFEINIDNIRDLGLFIEIEKNGEEKDMENIRKEIMDLLVLLGIGEGEIISKGYVQLILNK